jgi:hypothetical protein
MIIFDTKNPRKAWPFSKVIKIIIVFLRLRLRGAVSALLVMAACGGLGSAPCHAADAIVALPGHTSVEVHYTPWRRSAASAKKLALEAWTKFCGEDAEWSCTVERGSVLVHDPDCRLDITGVKTSTFPPAQQAIWVERYRCEGGHAVLVPSSLASGGFDRFCTAYLKDGRSLMCIVRPGEYDPSEDLTVPAPTLNLRPPEIR